MPWSVYPIWIGQRIDPQSQLQFLVALHNSPIAADENQSRQKKRQERKISPHIIPRLIAAIAANLPQMCSKTGPVHPGRGLQKLEIPKPKTLCYVCGIAKAVWLDREVGVKLCEHCYGRGVREDARAAVLG